MPQMCQEYLIYLPPPVQDNPQVPDDDPQPVCHQEFHAEEAQRNYQHAGIIGCQLVFAKELKGEGATIG